MNPVSGSAGLSGVLTWRTTTFVADDDEFRIERRLVSQTSTRIDYTKVQSVDLTQPLAARILGAGEGPEAARIRDALTTFRGALRDEAHAKGAALRERRADGIRD